MVASADIEVGHILPLNSNSLSEQLQRIFKAIKCQCGDKDIFKTSSIAAN